MPLQSTKGTGGQTLVASPNEVPEIAVGDTKPRPCISGTRPLPKIACDSLTREATETQPISGTAGALPPQVLTFKSDGLRSSQGTQPLGCRCSDPEVYPVFKCRGARIPRPKPWSRHDGGPVVGGKVEGRDEEDQRVDE